MSSFLKLPEKKHKEEREYDIWWHTLPRFKLVTKQKGCRAFKGEGSLLSCLVIAQLTVSCLLILGEVKVSRIESSVLARLILIVSKVFGAANLSKLHIFLSTEHFWHDSFDSSQKLSHQAWARCPGTVPVCSAACWTLQVKRLGLRPKNSIQNDKMTKVQNVRWFFSFLIYFLYVLDESKMIQNDKW